MKNFYGNILLPEEKTILSSAFIARTRRSSASRGKKPARIHKCISIATSAIPKLKLSLSQKHCVCKKRSDAHCIFVISRHPKLLSLPRARKTKGAVSTSRYVLITCFCRIQKCEIGRAHV